MYNPFLLDKNRHRQNTYTVGKYLKFICMIFKDKNINQLRLCDRSNLIYTHLTKEFKTPIFIIVEL